MVRIHTTYAKGPIRSFYFAHIFGEIQNHEFSNFVLFSSKTCDRNEENRQFLAGFRVPIFLDYTPLWEIVDSNHRRHCQQIYSLSPLATREISHALRAGGRIWTPDLLITNQLLYQLSYTSACLNALGATALAIILHAGVVVKRFFRGSRILSFGILLAFSCKFT